MEGRLVRRVRFVAAEQSPAAMAEVTAQVSFSAPLGGVVDPADAAREYLERVLALDAATRTSFDGAAEPLPETAVTRVQASKLTGTNVVRFTQAHAAIPVFGSDMLVEVGAAGQLVMVDADVATAIDAPAEPTIDPAAAAAAIARLAGVDPASLVIAEAPTLMYFHDDVDGDGDGDRWHLVWRFVRVPVAPVEAEHRHPGRGHGRSPRLRNAEFDYLVDAHDGAVVFHHSRTPRARAEAMPAVPIRCTGLDEAGVVQEFYGQASDGGFTLVDPLRKIRTVDLRGGDIGASKIKVPKEAIEHASADFGGDHRAAVSAHVNVGRVLDFYRSVFMRDGVDDRGMEIVSVVHCVAAEDEAPPSWTNAIWWDDRMWYGQRTAPDGRMRSLSVSLELVGHELTHGIIERTSDLIYKGASGALNESFSDIIGVIVANWYGAGPDAVDRWSWTFGAELGSDWKPLRDLQDPKRTGDPDHMRDYLKTREDDGGVHTNSNIHNKAAYLLLTATEADGARSLTTREVAVLYYLCLVRLPQRPTFARTLRGLLDVAAQYFVGDAAVQARKLAAIEAAYARVGITLEA
jgi:bacillolysin